MSKCQVIPLQGKFRPKHAETKIASFSAMLADGVADLINEQHHARIYAFHRPVASTPFAATSLSELSGDSLPHEPSK